MPAITPGKGRAGNDNRAGVAQRLKPRPTSPVIATEGTTGTMPSPGLKPAVIVRTKSRRASVFGDAPDMTADEHRRRGEAADALWRELIRRTAGGEWPVGATGPQAAEGTPVVHVRGFPYPMREGALQELIRPKAQDLFR